MNASGWNFLSKKLGGKPRGLPPNFHNQLCRDANLLQLIGLLVASAVPVTVFRIVPL
jgi:hypothetical protein